MGKKLKLAKSKTISYLKLPFDFFENHFQSFSPKTVKVYLYILYLCTLGDIEFDDETICERLSLSLNDLKKAYDDLRKYGMLVTNSETGEDEIVNPDDFYKEFHREVKSEIKKDTLDMVKNSAEDREFQKRIAFIENRFGKELTQNDYLEIYDLTENQKIPYDVLLAAIDYSVSKNKRSFSYISKIALNWKELGLTTYESCEQFINCGDDAFLKNVKKILKIDRNLFDVELKYIMEWREKMSKSLSDIEKAAEVSVINTGKISFPYINAVLCDKGGSSKSSSSASKKDRYHDFPQREYDYDEMLSELRKKQKK